MNNREEYKFVKVEYILDSRQQKALEELLPFFQNYIGPEKNRPFKDWTIEKLFQ